MDAAKRAFAAGGACAALRRSASLAGVRDWREGDGSIEISGGIIRSDIERIAARRVAGLRAAMKMKHGIRISIKELVHE
jgi:hypothetical protein